MADRLELDTFGLPPTFPPELVPDAGAQFVTQCWPGMSKHQLLSHARQRGWRPSWERLTHMVVLEGMEVYGFALTIDGCVVPFTVRMRRVKSRARVAKPSRPPVRDDRQLPLF